MNETPVEATVSETPTGEMRIMTREGDLKLMWDSAKQAEVDQARETFNKMKKDKRYIAYSVKKDGSLGKVITEFDPTAEKIILAPQMSGG